MAVILEARIERYIGLSTDDKPVGAFIDNTWYAVPAASTFLETDTGKIYRFDGSKWTWALPEDETAQLLMAIYMQLDQIRTAVELATAI